MRTFVFLIIKENSPLRYPLSISFEIAVESTVQPQPIILVVCPSVWNLIVLRHLLTTYEFVRAKEESFLFLVYFKLLLVRYIFGEARRVGGGAGTKY